MGLDRPAGPELPRGQKGFHGEPPPPHQIPAQNPWLPLWNTT